MSRFQELERSGSEAELEREEVLSIPEIKQRRADVKQMLVVKEEVPPEQQEWSPSLDQEEPPEPPHIKEEQEELWTSQEGEQLQGLGEADITKFLFTPVPVKSEDDEEKPEDSSETEDSEDYSKETREPQSGLENLKSDEVTEIYMRHNTGEPFKCSGADGEDCGGPEPARNSHPDPHLQPETEDSEDDREGKINVCKEAMGWYTEDKPFKCSECGKGFCLNRIRKAHMSIHTGENLFNCSVCGKGFNSRTHLETHLRIHTSERPFGCTICDKTFMEDGELNKHMAVHAGKKIFTCSICGRRFLMLGQLRQHMTLHTGEKRYSCSECGKRFARKEKLVEHMVVHTREKQMETGADGEDCGGPEPARNSHPDKNVQPETEDIDKDCKDPDRKSFCCSDCGKAFKHRGNLNIHMRTHTGVKPFSCSFCDKRFTQKVGLDYHLKIHSGEKPFSCSICNKSFRHKGAVTSHMATHTGLKPFCCDICGKRFRGTSHLKLHRCVGESARREKRVLPLSCSECDATFPNKYLLTTHMRMHKGKTLFTCTICGQKRQFSSHLEIHMRTHTGERPYSCSICGKKFSQRGIMTQHMATHSEVKPYGCNYCEKRFFWQFQIKKHKCPGVATLHRSGNQDPVGSSAPERHFRPDTDKTTKPSLETDKNVDVDFWKETRKHQSGLTYRRNKKFSAVEENDASKKPSFSDDTVQIEPKTDYGVDLWQSQSSVRHWKNEVVSISHAGANTDMKLSSYECRKRSEESGTHQTDCKEKLFSCLFCGEHFTTAGSLTRHNSVHTGDEPLSCIVCEKLFTSEAKLMSHECVPESLQLNQSQMKVEFKKRFQRIHTGRKPFSCSVCGKTFVKSESLSFHMTCHTAEKSFCCSVCNMGFDDSEALVKHMRIHTGQTQFSCSICGKEFAWRRYLTKHMAVHSKANIYSCSICDQRFNHYNQLTEHKCVGPQFSQLHRTEENREAEPGASSSTDQMEKGADGEAEDSSETEVSDDDLTREAQSCSESLKDDNVSHGDATCDMGEGGERFSNNNLLNIIIKDESLDQHVAVQPGEHREVKQEWSPSLGQEDPPEPPHIKEEQEELWTSQEGEQLQGLEEADITKFLFTPVSVKSEDDEEKPQSSQLHQRQTEQMETGADGEDCGGPEPARNSHLDPHFHLKIELKNEDRSETEDSVDSDFWKETRERPSGLNFLSNDETSESLMGWDSGMNPAESVEPESDDSIDSDFWKDNEKSELDLTSLKKNCELSESDVGSSTRRKRYSCSECGKKFLNICNMNNHMRFHTGERAFYCSVCGMKCLYKSHLKIHMRKHTGEKPFVCPVCGKQYAHKASMQSHMVIHTVETQYTCSVCGRGFAWNTELKYHQCPGESPKETPHVTS